jgi:hypothetical protein
MVLPHSQAISGKIDALEEGINYRLVYPSQGYGLLILSNERVFSECGIG